MTISLKQNWTLETEWWGPSSKEFVAFVLDAVLVQIVVCIFVGAFCLLALSSRFLRNWCWRGLRCWSWIWVNWLGGSFQDFGFGRCFAAAAFWSRRRFFLHRQYLWPLGCLVFLSFGWFLFLRWFLFGWFPLFGGSLCSLRTVWHIVIFNGWQGHRS